MNTHVFRNQASTVQKIQMISSLRITTKDEAAAFLRAIASINEQIAAVLQRSSMADLAERNKAKTPAPTPTPNKIPEEPKEAVPVNISDEDEHTEDDAQARKEQLLAAVKKAKPKKEEKEEKENLPF